MTKQPKQTVADLWAEIEALTARAVRAEALAASNARAHNAVEDDRFRLVQENRRLRRELGRLSPDD